MKHNYSGHLPNPVRDFTKPNFSLGSRDIGKALINASLEETGGVKNNTHTARCSACRDFSQFIKHETDVYTLMNINREHIVLYGEYLREQFESGELSASSARDYLSHINVCLSQARGDDSCKVLATRDLNYPPKSGIALVDSSTPILVHKRIVNDCCLPVAVTFELQRELGLRFREGALLDSTTLLKQARLGGEVEVNRGTKGGQARTIPIDKSSQLEALYKGHKLQESTGHDNAIPINMSLKAFQSFAWREAKMVDPSFRSHGERQHYACRFYEENLGVAPPVVSGVPHGEQHHQYITEQLSIDLNEAKRRDNAVRLALSKVLGHHRVVVTNAYVG
ncbi:integrase domain-containing protein [Vibrio breoganii]|uniref:integrase domain-containing protein n=1 Tax=Vibrio breoganii TaxID=553239 RepID=UPI0021C4B0C8|nr:integrase domain-containing protein [Vibrio breoganii]MDN3716563.1 integrase domain-containing protein [Vibrio breoganii]